MAKHALREHTTADEVLHRCLSVEDMDSWAVVGKTEDGQIAVVQYWKGGAKSSVADTLLEALYLEYGPDCYCEED